MYMAVDDNGGGSTSYAPSSQMSAPSAPSDATPSIPVPGGSSSSGSSSGTSSATETVAQAYLAALAAQGQNTAGDTAPYVVIPNQANPTGAGSSTLVVVLVVAALAFGVWWFVKRRKGG